MTVFRFAAAISIAASTSVAPSSADAMDHPFPSGYVQLKIDGSTLAWPQVPGGALKLKWSFARSDLETQGARNCSRMSNAKPEENFVPALHASAEAAFKYWQRVAAVDFEYVELPETADIVIGLQAHPVGIAYADVLYTASDNPSRGTITRGLVCLNAQVRWKTAFDGDLKSYDVRFVLAHEIGHVLGLDHPSATGQLMSWRYDERVSELQSGDVAGISALYGARNGDTKMLAGAVR